LNFHFFQCVNIVKKIQNKYIIEYLACWFGKETRTLNIITTHLDTLADFIGKVKTLRWRIIKKWAKQILRGLDHLHQQKPEIIHRNVNCSHVYIDGGLGTTNIGDLWLAAIFVEDQDNPIGLSDRMMQQLAQGSPAYIAPESFENETELPAALLTTKVDIYSFGMCVLEMITREEPYAECQEIAATGAGTGGGSVIHSTENHADRIRKKVLKSIPPKSLSLIPHPLATAFIRECLKPAHTRLSASELLLHEFLVPTQNDDGEIILNSRIGSDHNSQNENETENENENDSADPAVVLEHSHIIDVTQGSLTKGRSNVKYPGTADPPNQSELPIHLNRSLGENTHENIENEKVESVTTSLPMQGSTSVCGDVTTFSKAMTQTAATLIRHDEPSYVQADVNNNRVTVTEENHIKPSDNRMLQNNDIKSNDESSTVTSKTENIFWNQPTQDPLKKFLNQPLSPTHSNLLQKNQIDNSGCMSPYSVTSPHNKDRVGCVFPDSVEGQIDQKMIFFDDSFTTPSLSLSRDHERRLGKVLEDFEQGENVYMDKGVQDGRAEEDMRDDTGSGLKSIPLNSSIDNTVSPQVSSKNCVVENSDSASVHSNDKNSRVEETVNRNEKGKEKEKEREREKDRENGVKIGDTVTATAHAPSLPPSPKKNLKMMIEASQLQQEIEQQQQQQQRHLESVKSVLEHASVPPSCKDTGHAVVQQPGIHGSPGKSHAVRDETSTVISSNNNSSNINNSDIINVQKLSFDCSEESSADVQTKTSCSLVAIPLVNANELHLLVKIPAAFTRDLSTDKEVEFSFDSLTDNIEVIAEEMIQELGLTFTINELAEQISRLIHSVKSDNGTPSGSQIFLKSDLSIVLNSNLIASANNSSTYAADGLIPLGIITPRMRSDSDAGNVRNILSEDFSIGIKNSNIGSSSSFSQKKNENENDTVNDVNNKNRNENEIKNRNESESENEKENKNENVFEVNDVIFATKSDILRKSQDVAYQVESSTSHVNIPSIGLLRYSADADDGVGNRNALQCGDSDTVVLNHTVTSCRKDTVPLLHLGSGGDVIPCDVNRVTPSKGSEKSCTSVPSSPLQIDPSSLTGTPYKEPEVPSLSQPSQQPVDPFKSFPDADLKNRSENSDLKLESQSQSQPSSEYESQSTTLIKNPEYYDGRIVDHAKEEGREDTVKGGLFNRCRTPYGDHDRDRDRERDRERDKERDRDGISQSPSVQSIRSISSDSRTSKDGVVPVVHHCDPSDPAPLQDLSYGHTTLDRVCDTHSEGSSVQSIHNNIRTITNESRSQSFLSLASLGTNKSEPEPGTVDSPITPSSGTSIIPVSGLTSRLIPLGIEAETEAEARDDLDMQKEVEKMDKESRVARRAFEQRIQKHKLIQVRTILHCTYT
jgi:WNK lysine deficient protein kinase